MENVLQAIDLGLAGTGRIVGLVHDEQWSALTCCAGWDVRDVINHMVGGFNLMADTLTHGGLDGDFDRDWLGTDPVRAYRAAAQSVSAAWHRPDALTGPVTLTFGTVPGPLAAVIHLTEVVVHGSDIAVAIGAEDAIDQELCTELLTTMRRIGIEGFRVPGIFDPAVPVDPQLPSHRQLMAYLGRTVRPAAGRSVLALPATAGAGSA